MFPRRIGICCLPDLIHVLGGWVAKDEAANRSVDAVDGDLCLAATSKCRVGRIYLWSHRRVKSNNHHRRQCTKTSLVEGVEGATCAWQAWTSFLSILDQPTSRIKKRPSHGLLSQLSAWALLPDRQVRCSSDLSVGSVARLL